MIILLIILSLGLLGGIIHFAISPKSSKLLRLAALIALGVIALSLVICGILIIIGPKEDPDAALFQVFQDMPTQPQSRNIFDLVILGIILAVVSLVILKALRDQRKSAAGAIKKPGKAQLFDDDDDLDLQIRPEKKAKKEEKYEEIEKEEEKEDFGVFGDDDDSFDITKG